MHTHLAHPPHPDDQNLSPTSPAKILDAVSDTLLNAFARVRKPDDRFVDMRDSGDRFIEALTIQERLWGRSRSRMIGEFVTLLFLSVVWLLVIKGTSLDLNRISCGCCVVSQLLTLLFADMAGDYHDLAVAVQGLGYLESGITDPLNHFSNTLLEFSAILKHNVRAFFVLHIACYPTLAFSLHIKNVANTLRFPSPLRFLPHSLIQAHTTTDPFLTHLYSLHQYAQTQRAVLRLRDQKQLDFEELSDYLSGMTAERDRVAAGLSGRAGSSIGLGQFLRDRVDALRGAGDERSRVERMEKLDKKIREVGVCTCSF
jgi:sorting nexin-4